MARKRWAGAVAGLVLLLASGCGGGGDGIKMSPAPTNTTTTVARDPLGKWIADHPAAVTGLISSVRAIGTDTTTSEACRRLKDAVVNAYTTVNDAPIPDPDSQRYFLEAADDFNKAADQCNEALAPGAFSVQTNVALMKSYIDLGTAALRQMNQRWKVLGH